MLENPHCLGPFGAGRDLSRPTVSCRRLRFTGKLVALSCLEKLLSYNTFESVPQTNTGRQEENSKASEKTEFKELGKIIL